MSFVTPNVYNSQSVNFRLTLNFVTSFIGYESLHRLCKFRIPAVEFCKKYRANHLTASKKNFFLISNSNGHNAKIGIIYCNVP